MGCNNSSLKKIQREFEQTRRELDNTVNNLKAANETINNLETRFNEASKELEETKTQLQELQNYSIMNNIPSIPIPSIFLPNQNQEQNNDEVKLKENQQKENIDSYFKMSSMNMKSFFSPSKNENITENDEISK